MGQPAAEARGGGELCKPSGTVPIKENVFGSEMTFPPLYVSSSFGELRDAKEFCDATLACEDNELMESDLGSSQQRTIHNVEDSNITKWKNK